MTDFSVNTIRVNNSGGRTLLANWVEERACKRYDEDDKKQCYPYKHGHKGILTTNFGSRVDSLSTTQDCYREHFGNGIQSKGKKLQLLEKQLFEKLSSKVQEEFHPPPQLPDYRSVTKKDFFSKEFTPIEHVPEMPHDVVKEQPLTYWSEKVNVVHGVSQIKTKDSPFRKNASFSTPVEQQLDHLKPYERWNFDGV
ncbi:sperm-associated antigen 8-like [Xenia sp. Carnegie-2017]|uniref:sperm-associated antigen 8-like n=1 Tax=Xenia sp. Carnegie-2017 TaxID=2897299 RepID=UPI001F03EEF7|nr:sperm-associated antigen 8-like [Xenia sp. Carnegie-2017]